MNSLCVTELHDNFSNIQILSVAQQRFNDETLSLATITLI